VFSQQQVAYFRSDKVQEAKEKFAEDRMKFEMSKLRAESEMQEKARKVQNKRERSLDISAKLKRERSLAIEFSKQHLSVSKALQRHEFMNSRDTQVKKNTAFVSFLNSNEARQKELVRKYMEQRNLLRLSQAANDRRLIEAKIKEENETEQIESRSRVDNFRELREEAKRIGKDKSTQSASNLLYYNFELATESNNRNSRTKINSSN
jgi:hypothetical protein